MDALHKFIFKPLDYSLDIKYSKYSNSIDPAIYDVSAHNELYTSFAFFLDKMGKYILEKRKCNIYNYYAHLNFPPFPKFSTDEIDKLEKEIYTDEYKKIYLKTFKFISQHEGVILTYTFESSISLLTYLCIRDNDLISNNSKIIIFSNNHYMLDAVIYYTKYIKFSYKRNNIAFKLYTYNAPTDEKTINYLEHYVNNYLEPGNKYEIIDKPMILLSNNRIIDVAFIDLLIFIPGLAEIRTYAFQTYLSAIINVLAKLKKGGHLIINTSAITNGLIFDFFIYLSHYFDEVFIYEPQDTDMQSINPIVFSCIICKGYSGKIEIDKLLMMNKENYMYDMTGGFQYELSPDDKALVHNDYRSPNPPSKYLEKIVTIKNNEEYKTFQKSYKEYIKSKLLLILDGYITRYQLWLKRDDKLYIKGQCELAKMKAISYAKKYRLPMLEWIEKVPEEHFNFVMAQLTKNMSMPRIYQMKTIGKLDIDIYQQLVTTDECNKQLKEGYHIAEVMYQYIDKVNHKELKGIELFFNYEFKKLNKKLLGEYDVNINDKYVSRAWLKMYELLYETHFFDNFMGSEVRGFHICEAPGNFITSIAHFIKHNTKIGKYNWTAQSLAPDLADFYDSYGFIKGTSNQWDLGRDKSGDITRFENIEYYFNKYKGIDIITSDCGEKWTGDDVLPKDNLSVFQLLYALLFPKIGGNFIIKTFSTNRDLVFLSLLCVACYIYEKVYIFKSNINFWSPEIYYVGINKREWGDEIEKVILDYTKRITEGEIIYLIEKLSDDFCLDYTTIIHQYITNFTDMKKYFVFLSLNKGLFEAGKPLFVNFIEKAQQNWIDKYLKKRDKIEE